MPAQSQWRLVATAMILSGLGSSVVIAQLLNYPVFVCGGRNDPDGTILVIAQPLTGAISDGAGLLTFGVVPAWLSTPGSTALWICASGNWSSTTCWTGLDGTDLFPRNGAVNYAVTLPAGGYVVSVDPSTVEIGSLSMPGTGTILSINSGNSLIVQDAITAHGRLRAFGTLSASASSILDLTQCDLNAETGGTIALPLVTYSGVSGRIESLRANGAGSVLNLSALTSVNGAGNGMNLQAANGGTVLVPELTSIANASLSSLAPGSLLRLDSLATLPPLVGLTVSGGGTVIAAPLTRLDTSSVEIDGATSVCDLSNLTSIDRSIVQVEGGAHVSLPLVGTFVGMAGRIELLSANGANSVLELSALSSIDGGGNGMNLTASNGGVLRMPAVTSIANATLFAVGGGNLSTVLHLNSLTAVGGNVRIDVTGGATLNAAPLTAISEAILNVSGATSVFNTSAVTNLNGTSVTVQQGAVVRLPLVTSYSSTSGSAIESLQVVHANSLLDLNSAATIQSLASAGLSLVARFGGRFEAQHVQSLLGNITLRCDGTDGTSTSTLDLGDISLAANAGVQIGAIGGGGPSPGGEVWCHGDFSYATTNPNQFLWSSEAVLRMTGGAPSACVQLEVAGEDRGDVPAGWTSNFKLGHLVIGPAAHVRLTDVLDNHTPALAGPEALYVESVEFMDSGGRLYTNGTNLYYHSIVGNLSQIIDGTCSCQGDTDESGVVDLADLSRVLSSYGLCINDPGFDSAADLNADACVDLVDLSLLLSRFGTSCP
jgi:hypothetical protein